MEELIKTDDDINEILQTLKKIKVNINISPNASNSDKGLYNLLIEGTAENDFKKIYGFVQSVEMGCGFDSGEMIKLKRVYDKVFDTSPNEVIEILNHKNKLIDIVYNCYCIQTEMKIMLLQSSFLNNEFVIFELIRQLLNNLSVDELNNNSTDYKKVVGDAIIQLALRNNLLFQYFVEKFEHKEQFYHVIPIALSDMQVTEREMYANSINIDNKGCNYYDYVRILLQNIDGTKFDSFITDINEIIYQRWNDYLSNLLISKEFVSDIILTSYGDLILNCLCKRYEDKELFFMDFENVLNKFNEATYKWYEEGTEFSSMYYIYATKLFFFKKVQEVNKISFSNRKAIYNKMISIFENNFMAHNRYIELDDVVLKFDLNM